MVKLGYKLMAEEHGPAALVRNTVRAEQAGFAFAAISDHFFPWLDEQGHAPFAWSVLGAAAQATRQIQLMTAVTCPIMRYHPAIIAQGAATMAVLSKNRFILGLGAGERLNEHVIGEGWPGIGERHERFSEAYDIIRGLLEGSIRNYRGKYFMLDDAKLYDRPDRAPAIIGAAGGPEADTMERFADGQAFGEAGSYLQIKGIAKGEIDPATPENSVITDLDKALRNAHGMVEYETDFFIQ